MTVENTLLTKIFTPIHRPRPSSNRGGVAILYRKDLKGILPREDLDDPDLESVWLETRIDGESLIIGSIYIPPPGEEAKAFMALHKILHFLGPDQRVLITGDPNSRNLAWEAWHHSIPKQDYYAWKRGKWILNMAEKHGLTVANDGRYTRSDAGNFSAPDVTLIRDLPTLQWNVDHCINLNSDHLPILLSFPDPPTYSQTRWKMRDADWQGWCKETKAFSDFHNEVINMSPNKTMESLANKIVKSADEFFPLREICSHSKGFFSPELRTLIAKVKHARKRFKYRSDSVNKQALDVAVKEFIDLYHQSKEMHQIELCKNLKADDKKLWPKICKIKGGGVRAAIQPLVDPSSKDKKVEFDDENINKILIEHHIKPPPPRKYDIEWHKQVNKSVEETLKKEKSDIALNVQTYNRQVSQQEIDAAIAAPDPYSAPGPDRILPILVQKGHHNINKALHYSINIAFDEGNFPDCNKRENRSYLAKDGRKKYNFANSYRSISLSSVLGKTHERVLAGRLTCFMDENGLWDPHQYAYRKNRSLVQALMFYVISVISARSQDMFTATTFIDLEGAYDRVWRNGLLYKLHQAGLRGKLFLSIASFLTNRFARSFANGDVSDWIETLLGLPQGSILSPILFIFFIMDLTYRIPNQISYADDLSLWISALTLEECQLNTKSAIQDVTEWCYKWGQSHHKTEIMIHGPRKQKGTIEILDQEDKPIPQVKTRKLLGVILDEELEFKDHISFITGRAMSALHGIAPIIKHTPWNTALTVGKALVTAHLTRTYPVWCHAKASISSLEKAHRSLLMKATQLMPGTSTTALEILTGTVPLDLALSEVLCQETARLQTHTMDFPLLALITNLCQNNTFMSAGSSPLHTILRTIHDLDLEKHLTSIECRPSSSAPQYLDLKRPYVHRGPDIGKAKRNWSDIDKMEAHIHVLKEVLNVPANCPISFTDGSALGNPGPCGGAALMMMEGLDGPQTPILNPGSPDSNSYFGELLGLETALRTVALEAIILPSEFHCFIDCTSAIECAAGTCQATGQYETVQDIHELIDFLERRNCRVHLHWAPSHIGISLNEKVDEYAKEAAEQASQMCNDEAALCTRTVQQAKRAIGRAVDRRWQRRWDRDTCRTRRFITHVGRQVKHRMPRKAEAARAGCISGHNRLSEHLHRLKLKESAMCTCGLEMQTPEHVLMNCPLHQTARTRMVNSIELAFIKYDTPAYKRSLSFKNLLLPKYNAETNAIVSSATSDFFMSCSGVNF